MPADVVLNAPAFLLRHTIHNGEVGLRNTALGEGLGEAAVGGVVLRHDHAAAGVLVQAVDDARPHLPADAAEVGDVVEQRVDQRAVGISLRRMNDKPGRLVQHYHVRILIQYRQGNVLGLDLHLSYIRHRDTHHIS